MSSSAVNKDLLERRYTLAQTLGYARAAKKEGVSKETIRRSCRAYKQHFLSNTKGMKVLLLDIENSPSLAYIWSLWKEPASFKFVEEDWYVMSWAAKWLGDKTTKCMALPDYPGYKKDPTDDKALLQGIWGLMDEADVIIGHNCVEVSTPVLKQDLTWVPAGSLGTGDKLVGFDEKVPPGGTCRDSNGVWVGTGDTERKIRGCEVEEFCIEEQPCLEVVFENGESVITTKDHYWLCKASKDENLRWRKTEDLVPGQHRMVKYLNVWEQDRSYEGGWLSGFISGEGSLRGFVSAKGKGLSLDICQRPGVTWDQALAFCEKTGIDMTAGRSPHISGLGELDTIYATSTGGKFKTLEHIGRLSIQRFIAKINWDCAGALRGGGLLHNRVVEVRDAGVRKVAVFATTSRTFIGAGYAMHNCKRFDARKLNARFAANDMPPPSPYRTVDTLLEARSNFMFMANDLNSLGKILGVGEKIDNGGFDLWRNCMKGDMDAWAMMKKYNVQDVDLLESVYLRLRPYMKGNPNFGVYSDEETEICPTCGSSNVKIDGTVATDSSRFARYYCLDCKSWSRGRKNLLPKGKTKSTIQKIA